MKSHHQPSLFAIAIVVIAFTAGAVPSLKAASAVAIATNKNTGRLCYGYWKGDASVTEAKNRALDYCKHMGWTNPRVIGSTSRRGYGAVVWYETGDGKSRSTVSLGEPTVQQAISAALRKAKAAGGRYALVEATFHDGAGDSRSDLIKL
jgi:hypothetical protein